jgi:hypothetical protein
MNDGNQGLELGLLVAQAFILRFPKYGREFGLSAINYAIEDGIKQGLF